jgi:hypothetical protein
MLVSVGEINISNYGYNMISYVQKTEKKNPTNALVKNFELNFNI